ncbi:DUF3325 domain-containing protein [Tardiphaga sp.]|jgi:hypothetical protein|uniref:DUF3325 domain-containing protein n=1 Tax=Tardiphaga sp. TaxID=1926292 RepID=UPI0037DA2234
MIALAFALTYTGWAALCFAMPSHARSLRGRPFIQPIVVTLRCIGTIALLVALPVTAQAWGWPSGTTAWFGILTVACLALIGLLAINPKVALLPLVGLPTAAIIGLLR